VQKRPTETDAGRERCDDSTRIRVLVADDHRMVLESIVTLLSRTQDIAVVATAATGGEAVTRARQTSPDVAVMDYFMPRLNGIDATPRLVELGASVIILTDCHDDQLLLESLRAGASVCLPKEAAASDLLAAIRDLVRGRILPSSESSPTPSRSRLSARLERELTLRERHVLQLIAEGKSTKEVADWLGIAVKTAEHCRSRLSQKLGIHGVAALTRYAVRKGIVCV